MSKNTNLHKAKSAKNDEFYTQYEDIENELQHYIHHFEGKVIYCNCDAEWSNFWKYFKDNFNKFKLKKLISTHYEKDKTSYKLEYDGVEEVKTSLTGDGDFRSDECITILKEVDIVVTIPPFSLFREYIAQLMEYKKKFLIIGNMNAITYKEIFSLIKNNKIWMGMTMNGVGEHWFEVPDNYNHGKIKTNGKIKLATIGNACWFSNLDHKKRHEKLDLYMEYKGNESKYLKYDNYDAINVNKVVDIPKDYNGVMGVPITFLGKYNPEQFEIIKFRKGNDEKDLCINGKCPYFRIIIKHKLDT